MINYSFSIANFEYFLLILVRIASFVYIAPFFGDNAVPARVKTGLSAFVALFMYNIIERPQLSYVSAVGFAVLVVTGLLIGFAANICNSIVIFAGNLIDMDIGLSMATEFNPSMNSETTVTGNFYYYVVLVLLLVSDMHTYLIRAVCDSFSVVPLGGAQFQFDNMLSTMTKYMGDMFVIGFRIFLPVFACMMIMNCILGIMAKVAPQMNMFSVGIQLKIIAGFIPSVANFIITEIKTMVVSIIDGMY
jgi:flagellar biosynthetic protein FliR